MKSHLAICAVLGLGMLLAVSVFAGEEDERGTKKFGVVHNIAEDRQIEKVGGLYQPEGLDIYVKRHMDSLDGKVQGIENRLDGMNQKLDELSGLVKTMAQNLKQTDGKEDKKK